MWPNRDQKTEANTCVTSVQYTRVCMFSGSGEWLQKLQELRDAAIAIHVRLRNAAIHIPRSTTSGRSDTRTAIVRIDTTQRYS